MRGLFQALLSLALCFVAATASAAKYAPPPIAGHVTDAAGKLTPAQIAALNQKLADYRKCSSKHIAVFFPKSLEGNSIEDVAYITFNTWKIGEAKKDNGALLVLATSERKTRIETGKGAGGDLTDLDSFHVLREVVGPRLKADQFFEAADEGTTAIAKAFGGCAVDGVTSTPPPPPVDPPPRAVEWPMLLEMAAAIAFVTFLTGAAWRMYRGGLITGGIFGAVLLYAMRSAAVDGAGSFSPDPATRIFGISVVILGLFAIMAWISRYSGGKSSSSSRDWSSSSTSSTSDWSSSSSSSSTSDYSSSSSSSDYSGGGGSSGGGGASDSY